MKQTFNIPEGCKVVTVEQVGNQIITSFEPEKYVPKKGDCVRLWYKKERIPVYCLIDSIDGQRLFAKNVWIDNSDGDKLSIAFENSSFVCYKSIEKITPEEFQAEFEKLGYVYDFETHTARKKRKRANKDERYFYSDKFFEVDEHIEDSDDVDDLLYEAGNYFETKAECQKYCDYMKECSLKYFEQ